MLRIGQAGWFQLSTGKSCRELMVGTPQWCCSHWIGACTAMVSFGRRILRVLELGRARMWPLGL